MVAAGLAVAGPVVLKTTVTAMCSVKDKSPGSITIFLRENNIDDAVRAAVIRKTQKARKIQKKAQAQANKLADFDVATETELAGTIQNLEDEMATFGNAKIALRTYLQTQYKSRRMLRSGIYNSIPMVSEFRQQVKPYALRMNPLPAPGTKINTKSQIAYLRKLLHLMISEDLMRPLEPTARLEDQKLVRQLPVISERYVNPESIRLKKLQEASVASMASPKDNPWFELLRAEYMGKILYDGGFFRVFLIQFNPNKGALISLTTFPSPTRPTNVSIYNPFPKAKMFTRVGKRPQSLCTRTTKDNLWSTRVTLPSLQMAHQNS